MEFFISIEKPLLIKSIGFTIEINREWKTYLINIQLWLLDFHIGFKDRSDENVS